MYVNIHFSFMFLCSRYVLSHSPLSPAQTPLHMPCTEYISIYLSIYLSIYIYIYYMKYSLNKKRTILYYIILFYIYYLYSIAPKPCNPWPYVRSLDPKQTVTQTTIITCTRFSRTLIRHILYKPYDPKTLRAPSCENPTPQKP